MEEAFPLPRPLVSLPLPTGGRDVRHEPTIVAVPLRRQGRAQSFCIFTKLPNERSTQGDRAAIPMISRDDRMPLLRLISASLDSVSPSIRRLQPRYMFLRLTFRSSLAS